METPRRTRVLTVDDDVLVRDAYRTFFRAQDQYVLVGEARNGQEAIDSYATLLPDVVLMDLQMPGVDGVEATRTICSRWADACVVVLTTFGSREHVVAALRAGASGYLLKDTRGQALLGGIHQAMLGDMPLSSTIRRLLVQSLNDPEQIAREPVDIGLTPRELELLGWLAQGMTNYQIGRQMFVSEGSVKQYLTHIGQKMDAKSRTQILIKAIQMNLVNPHETPEPVAAAR